MSSAVANAVGIGGWLAYLVEQHLIVVNALLLHDAFGYQPGFVALNVAQSNLLELEDPLHWNGLDPGRHLLQGLCVVFFKSHINSKLPLSCIFIGLRFLRLSAPQALLL